MKLSDFGGGIKSVQRGTTTGSASVTISAVNLSKSFVTSSCNFSAGANGIVSLSKAKLVDSTTLSISAQGNGVATVTTEWEVVEFK